MNETLLMVFTGVLTLAVVIQTILFFGIFKAIRQMRVYLDGVGKDLLKNVELISAKVDEGLTAIKGVAEGFRPIRDKLVDSTEIIHYRITELDAFLAEATNTARREIRRVQDTFQAASQKVEETLDILRKSLLGPLNEISAFTRAVRVAMDVLFRRRKNPSSSQDEEMFI
jgi:hypothetical protein